MIIWISIFIICIKQQVHIYFNESPIFFIAHQAIGVQIQAYLQDTAFSFRLMSRITQTIHTRCLEAVAEIWYGCSSVSSFPCTKCNEHIQLCVVGDSTGVETVSGNKPWSNAHICLYYFTASEILSTQHLSSSRDQYIANNCCRYH